MTTINGPDRKKYEAAPLKACLIAEGNRRENVQRVLVDSNLLIRHRERLQDLVKDRDCSLYVIDTSIKDMDSWPAPLLTIPNASSKDWLFLVSRLSDAFRLHPLPQNARLLDGKRLSAEKIASLIKKHLDPDSRKRFARVKYIEDLRAFLAWMENGKTYAVPISELPEADATTVVRWSLSRDRSHIKVWQESGNAFEIPWDDVLYHCEPQYDFYKGKQPGDANANVRQIGSRIRQLRQEKGYSVQRLAERIGMRRPNLSRLEHGHHQPSLDTLQKIAGALEVPVVELVARKR